MKKEKEVLFHERALVNYTLELGKAKGSHNNIVQQPETFTSTRTSLSPALSSLSLPHKSCLIETNPS